MPRARRSTRFSMTDRRVFLQSSVAAVAALGAGCSGADRLPAPGVPRSDFDESSTAEEVTGGIDLSGKLAVITGATSGIGFETMRVLAKRGAVVVATSRSLERAHEACERIVGAAIPLQLELGDVESVIACANAIRSINLAVDILVCNAGYYGGSGSAERVNGLEKHFAINHLGHFLLFNRLAGRLYMARQGRVVVVSSRAAYRRAPVNGIEFDNLDAARDYDDARAYGHSKLANALFALHLSELLKGTRITANALHPGVINTEIDRHMGRFTQFGFSLASALGYGKSIEAGAATSCYVATSPGAGRGQRQVLRGLQRRQYRRQGVHSRRRHGSAAVASFRGSDAGPSRDSHRA